MTATHGDRADRGTRDDLTGEHTLSDVGQIVFACLFAIVWVSDTFFLRYGTLLNGYVSLAVRIPLAAVVMGLSGYFARRGLSIVFGEVREKPSVIRKSVFGIVRHPVYLGEVLLYLGFLCLSVSLMAAVVWVVAIAFLHYTSRHEEKLLLARFGAEYEQYMHDVPMWIPRLQRR
jgi:protein-S-isoprenylcysteine O-methyltransferase Ste14